MLAKFGRFVLAKHIKTQADDLIRSEFEFSTFPCIVFDRSKFSELRALNFRHFWLFYRICPGPRRATISETRRAGAISRLGTGHASERMLVVVVLGRWRFRQSTNASTTFCAFAKHLRHRRQYRRAPSPPHALADVIWLSNGSRVPQTSTRADALARPRCSPSSSHHPAHPSAPRLWPGHAGHVHLPSHPLERSIRERGHPPEDLVGASECFQRCSSSVPRSDPTRSPPLSLRPPSACPSPRRASQYPVVRTRHQDRASECLWHDDDDDVLLPLATACNVPALLPLPPPLNRPHPPYTARCLRWAPSRGHPPSLLDDDNRVALRAARRRRPLVPHPSNALLPSRQTSSPPARRVSHPFLLAQTTSFVARRSWTGSRVACSPSCRRSTRCPPCSLAPLLFRWRTPLGPADANGEQADCCCRRRGPLLACVAICRCHTSFLLQPLLDDGPPPMGRWVDRTGEM